MIKGIVVATLLLSSSGAQAHDWYPKQCCVEEHCHPVPCEAISKRGALLLYDGLEFGGDKIKNTQDDKCHVCIVTNGLGRHAVCIFVQNGS